MQNTELNLKLKASYKQQIDTSRNMQGILLLTLCTCEVLFGTGNIISEVLLGNPFFNINLK